MKIINLETLLDELPENRYILFLDKGRHFFDVKCSSKKNIDEKYRQRKWPFLFDVKEQKVVVPGLSKTDHYPRVHLNKKDNTQKFIYIHQIVGLTIPNEENKPIINHKNLDTFDYSVDNLEWATFSENATGSKRPSLDYDKVYDFFKIKEDLFKC